MQKIKQAASELLAACMFGQTADSGHKATRVVLTLTGSVPRKIP